MKCGDNKMALTIWLAPIITLMMFCNKSENNSQKRSWDLLCNPTLVCAARKKKSKPKINSQPISLSATQLILKITIYLINTSLIFMIKFLLAINLGRGQIYQHAKQKVNPNQSKSDTYPLSRNWRLQPRRSEKVCK